MATCRHNEWNLFDTQIIGHTCVTPIVTSLNNCWKVMETVASPWLHPKNLNSRSKSFEEGDKLNTHSSISNNTNQITLGIQVNWTPSLLLLMNFINDRI